MSGFTGLKYVKPSSGGVPQRASDHRNAKMWKNKHTYHIRQTKKSFDFKQSDWLKEDVEQNRIKPL